MDVLNSKLSPSGLLTPFTDRSLELILEMIRCSVSAEGFAVAMLEGGSPLILAAHGSVTLLENAEFEHTILDCLAPEPVRCARGPSMGFPLTDPSGEWLGASLCVIGYAPGEMPEDKLQLLWTASRLVAFEVDRNLRRIGSLDPGVTKTADFSNLVSDLAFTHDLDGNFTSINKAVERLTGYSREEVLGMNFLDLMPEDAREIGRAAIQQQFGSGTSTHRRLPVQTKDGRRFTLELTTRLAFDHGRPVAIEGFGRDVSTAKRVDSARRRAEKKLREKRDELSRFTTNLKRLHRLSTAEYGSLREVFDKFLLTGRDIFSLPSGVVAQVENGTFLVRAVQSAVFLEEGQSIPLSSTYSMQIVATRRTLAFSDPAESGWLEHEAARTRFPLQTYIGTPILVENQVWGTLSFASSTPLPGRTFSKEEREFMELMGESLGKFILREETRMRREKAQRLERDRNQVLEMVARDRALDEVLARLAGVLESHDHGLHCSILLTTGGRLHCGAAPRFPEGMRGWFELMAVPLEWMARQEPPESTPLRLFSCQPGSPEWAIHAGAFPAGEQRAYLLSPVTSGNGVLLGALTVWAAEPKTLEELDLAVIETARRLAGLAIEQRQMTDQLAFQAAHDSLTRLPNHAAQIGRFEKLIAEARQGGQRVAVMYVDLDRFKQINDTLGHAVGDELLQRVAARLADQIRVQDCIARMGGDEFTILMPGIEDKAEAIEMADRVIKILESPILLGGRELFVNGSVGLSFFPDDGEDPQALLRHADLAMYCAKNLGRRTVECYQPEMDSERLQRLDIENYLRRAVDQSEFQMLFQPQVDRAGRIDSLEVLLAWDHPRLGRVAPSSFIPIAEESGMIIAIGAWVLEQACRQARQWVESGLPTVKIAVNVSSLQFARADFVDVVQRALDVSGMPARLLELELTESLVMRDVEQSVERMSALRNLGVSLSIDDFGTGYSSLSYLRGLPVDVLKIDQSFIRDMDAAQGTVQLIRAIARLGHTLGLRVVAEGVETARQYELARRAGCDLLQGHYLAEPADAATTQERLKNGLSRGGAYMRQGQDT